MANNTVTFYQPINAVHSMRGIVAAVTVEGMPAPWLELLEITRSKGPELNRARFRVTGHSLGPAGRFEDVAAAALPGRRIEVSLTFSRDTATGNQICWPLFNGLISRGSAGMAGNGEDVEVVACDRQSYFDSAVVDGVYALGPGEKVVELKSVDVVFNPDGQGNRCAEPVQINGKNTHVFQLNKAKAFYWTPAGAIGYIARAYLEGDAISEAEFSSLEGMTRGEVLRDVDVSGLSPLRAIGRLCERAGLCYRVVNWPDAEGRGKETMVFYRRGKGREIFLRHQAAGEALDLHRTNLVQCKVDTAGPAETMRVIGRGDVKRFESTFELVKAWDPSLEVDDYDKYSPSTNADFLEVRDVFRKWTLNEGGDYSGAPYNQGEAYDLGGLFGTGSYSCRRRRFWPCLSRDAAGESLGYYVEISYDDGDSWQPYGGAFNHLLDECGIYLSSNQLDTFTWIAIRKDKLRFRITASVDSDERLESILSDGPIDGVRPVRTVVVDMGNEYKYRQVSCGSIFYDWAGAELGKPDVADDSENLRGQVRDHLGRLGRNRLAGSAELCWVHPDIWPGAVVSAVSGRGLEFCGATKGLEYKPQVEKVRIILGRHWSTTISFGEG